MTNTKWLSALLAGTALVAVGTAAKADELSTLKAQLEALQAQVASMQAAPALPTGASLLTVKYTAGEGATFSVAPTADMPAPATEVTLSGEVRSLVSHYNWDAETTNSYHTDSSEAATDVATRARVKVNAKTATSVGEVGVYARLQAKNGGTASINDYYGYWAISDSLKLTSGHSDTIAAVQGGADWNATGGVWDGSGAGLTDPGVEFAKLTMTSGPITADVAVESSLDSSDSPAVAGSVVFGAMEGLSLQVAARSEKDGGDDNTMVGGSANFSMDRVTVSLGAATGNGGSGSWTYLTHDSSSGLDDDWTAYSGLVTVALTEDVRVEAYAGKAVNDSESDLAYDDITGYGAGVFWSPVKQLTLGVGADTYTATQDGYDYDNTNVGVGAWFKF